MNYSEQNQQDHQTQQFHRQYGANAILPEIDWSTLFKFSKLDQTHIVALNTLYQNAVPLALKVFDELKFDNFLTDPSYALVSSSVNLKAIIIYL